MATYFSVMLLLGLAGVLAAYIIPSEKVLYRKPGTKPVGSNTLGIYDGKATTIKKHSYLVAVQYYSYFLCAGTIIADSWVLLSADCIYGADRSELTVLVNSKDSTSGKKYNVKQVLVHPKYEEQMFLDYDYGLLEIKGKFKWSNTVKKMVLPHKDIKNGSEADVIGWGSESSNSELVHGKMKVISREQCAKIYEDYGLTFTDRMTCLYDKGKTTLCDGDWSDPATEGNMVYGMFIAIAASGECSSNAYPAICADVYAAEPWIKNATKLEFN